MLMGWADRVVDFWNRFLENKQGIQVLMENVQDPEIEPILEVAERVKHPDFGLCLDMGHAHCYGEDSLTRWARCLGPHVKHVHLHDNDGIHDQHLAPGEGNAPLKEALSSVFFHNPNVTFTIECSSRQAVLDSVQWLQLETRKYMIRN
jgi:sugar phosphate isomerase/epimerase